MMNERYMQKKQCQTYKPRYRGIIDYLTPIGIFQFLFGYGMEEQIDKLSKSAFTAKYARFRPLKKREEGNE